MARKVFEVGRVILLWFVANLLGVAAAAGISSLLSFLTSFHGILASSVIIGLPIGFAQWIVLRRAARISILWVFTISMGLVLGLAVNPILARLWGFRDDESILALTAAYAVFGFLVGLAQWLLLRGQFTRAWVWPLSSAAGFGLGLGLVLVTSLVDRSGIISFLLGALVYAAATGWVIWRLPTQRRIAVGEGLESEENNVVSCIQEVMGVWVRKIIRRAEASGNLLDETNLPLSGCFAHSPNKPRYLQSPAQSNPHPRPSPKIARAAIFGERCLHKAGYQPISE